MSLTVRIALRIFAGIKLLSVLALLVLTSRVAVASGSAHLTTALDALRRAQPNVTWDEKSSVSADVTCDGIPEMLVLGYQSGRVWLGVVGQTKGSATPKKIETLSFNVGKGTQDSFCAIPVHIDTESIECNTEDGPLSGCKPVKGCRQFSLVDDSCDSFHFHWDSTNRQLKWWRR